MTEDQAELLRKAEESLAAARLLLKEGYADYAASRAYYTMFYVAEALLEGEKLSFSKHSAVIAAFGQHFTRTGKISGSLHRYIIEALELRNAGDYGGLHSVTMEKPQEAIDHGQEFLEAAEKLLIADTR
ncbi:MAG: HEPN domain-containing protein [Candidatus Eremiobacteraeota bacterium]|nr:HEPN domain-containing protein [Candidatus Eremiobacteraeota bacterium]